jgi:hypothetical protein
MVAAQSKSPSLDLNLYISYLSHTPSAAFFPCDSLCIWTYRIKDQNVDSESTPLSLSGSHTRAVESGGLNTSEFLSAYTPDLTYLVFYECPRLFTA